MTENYSLCTCSIITKLQAEKKSLMKRSHVCLIYIFQMGQGESGIMNRVHS